MLETDAVNDSPETRLGRDCAHVYPRAFGPLDDSTNGAVLAPVTIAYETYGTSQLRRATMSSSSAMR